MNMLNSSPINLSKVDEMSYDDADFKAELILALFNSLQELKEKYLLGASLQNVGIIQSIRHKVKPTLEVFEVKAIYTVLYQGKDLMDNEGFSENFMRHLLTFEEKVNEAIDFLSPFVRSAD
jgi:hypothetical protein